MESDDDDYVMQLVILPSLMHEKDYLVEQPEGTGPLWVESLVPDSSYVRRKDAMPELQLSQKRELPAREETLFTGEGVPLVLEGAKMLEEVDDPGKWGSQHK